MVKDGGSFWMVINPYLKNGEPGKPTYENWWLDFQGISINTVFIAFAKRSLAQ